MHRRGHPRAGPPRLQRQHPFALPSCVSASVLEALPTGQDHIRYSQPKSNQHQPHKSQFHKSVCVWSQKGGLTTLRWAMARSARACLLRRLLFSSCRHDGFGSLAVLGVLDVGKLGSWEVGTRHPLRACPPRKKQFHCQCAGEARKRVVQQCCRQMPESRARPTEGTADLPTENGFVGIPRRKEES